MITHYILHATTTITTTTITMSTNTTTATLTTTISTTTATTNTIITTPLLYYSLQLLHQIPELTTHYQTNTTFSQFTV